MNTHVRRRVGLRAALVGATASLAIVVLAASAAWACLSHIGAMKVCNYPADADGTKHCTKSNYDTGVYDKPINGGATISQAGTTVVVSATNMKAVKYFIKWGDPGEERADDCHSMGTTLGDPVMGPTFSGKVRTIPASTAIGRGVVCIQDKVPLTSNQVQIQVI